MQQRSPVFVTAALMVGLLVAALDQTIVDTAFPRMIADLHGEKIVTWVLTVYLLASTAVVPVVGKLADIYGRKVFYQVGLAIFVIGSMLCGAAQSMIQLIIFRGIQGIGGGMLMPITLTIVGDLYPGEKRAKVQGVFGAVFGLSSVIGPKLGGWITHHLDWRWVFYVNLPIGIIAFLMMLFAYKESKGQPRPVDWAGSATIVGGVVTLLLALNRGEEWGWSAPATIGLFAASAAMLISFLVIESRVPEPVIDLKLFRNRTFSVMAALAFLQGAAMLGCIFFVPYFVQGVLGLNPDQAGNITIPMMLTMVTFSILAGRLSLKVPYRYQISVGFILVALGFYTMTFWGVDTSSLRTTGSIMIVGAGLGLMMPILTLAVQNAFPAHKRGVVTSAATFFRQIGSTVGLTIFGVIFNHQIAQEFNANLAPTMKQMAPMVAQLPAQAQEFFNQVFDAPQILVRLLMAEEARAAIPEAFAESLFGGTKLMMVDAMHFVFWCGIAVVAVGFVVAQLLGNTSLKQQAAENGGEIHLESPIAAD